jgi:hypothetical protein
MTRCSRACRCVTFVFEWCYVVTMLSLNCVLGTVSFGNLVEFVKRLDDEVLQSLPACC